ncbi:MAG: hypothetical protein ACYCZV_09350 [Acidimicrobiales bacterium]
MSDRGRQGGRALVATLAGTIAVLGSVAGSTAFVMESMKSTPDMSVSVAPVITLRPAMPNGAAARPTVSAGNGSVATRPRSMAAPTAAAAHRAVPALNPLATPALTSRLLAAAQVPTVVHRAVSTATGVLAQAGAATKPVMAAPSPAVAAAQSLATVAIDLPGATPAVTGPRVAEIPTVRGLHGLTPTPLVAPVRVARARVDQVAARTRAMAVSVGSHSHRATVALSRFASARKVQGGGHRLWAETDGLNGPSTHH